MCRGHRPAHCACALSSALFSLRTFNFPETQMDRHCMACTSCQVLCSWRENSHGGHTVSSFLKTARRPCQLPSRTFWKTVCTPHSRKNLSRTGFSLVLCHLALGLLPWQGVLCIPRFGWWCFRACCFREIRSFLLGKKISLVCCVLYGNGFRFLFSLSYI